MIGHIIAVLALGAAIAIVVFGTPSQAKSERWLTNVMLRHIAWIEQNSDYDYQGEKLPKVEYHTYEQMLRLRWGDRWREAFTNGALIYGMYNPNNNTIVLPVGFDWSDKGNHATIVHELVHFLQFVRGDMDRVVCKSRLEVPAYRLHIEWSRQHGVDNPNLKDGMQDHLSAVSHCDQMGIY